MELEQTKERELLNCKLQELKSLSQSLDTFKVGNFVDIMDENKNWCVGQVIERVGDIIAVHYEGCPTKLDEKVSVKKNFKVNHFRKYSRNYSGIKKTAVRNYCFNPDDVKEIEGFIRHFTEDKFQSGDALETTQILRGKIFTYIDIFMTTNYSLKEQNVAVPLICELIFQYLDMSVEFFKFYKENLFIVNEYLTKHKDLFLIHNKCAVLAALNEVICTLKRIFGEDPRVGEFYKNNEDMIKKYFKSNNFPNFKAKICIEKAYKTSSQYNNLPAPIIASLLDYFYDKKGFESIFSIILINTKASQTIPFEILEPLMQFLALFKIVIDTKTAFPNEISQIRAYFYSRISNLTENEIKEIKKANLVNTLKSFSVIIPADAKIQKNIFEDLYLNYHYKCIVSKNLEKRIAGIAAINLIIDTVDRKENYSNFSNQAKIDIDENIETTDSKTLLTFFKDKNFLDILLGENIHEEIIKRSLPFFKLLAKKSSLSTSVYDLLWKNYLEKHESIAIQIETIICELSFYIPEKDRQYLFAKLKTLTETNHSAKMIVFMKNFTESCLKKTLMAYSSIKAVDFFNDEKMYGLPLLWNYMQDSAFNKSQLNTNAMITDTSVVQSSQQASEIIELSMNSIIELMTINQVDDFVKEKIISLCLDNIGNSTSVIQSHILMRKIIMDFPNIKSKRTVKKMDETFNLINLFLVDFQNYMLRVRESIKDFNKSSNLVNQMNTFFEGFYSHKTCIEARLDSIYFFANAHKERGRVPMTSDHIDQLWSLLILEESCESERNIFIDSLRKNCDDLDEELTEYIFTRLITNKEKMDFANFNLNAYNLFEKFLQVTNYNKSKLSWDGRNYRVGQEEIIGTDTIFSIICEVTNDNVRRSMCNLLVLLCLNLKYFVEDFSNKYWKTLMDKMFQTLTDSYKEKNEKGIKGMIFFIRNLLRDIGISGEIPIYDEVSFVKEGLEYTFVYPEKNDNRTIKIGVNELVCDARVKVAYFFDVPVNLLKLKNKQRVIDMSDDFKVFKELITVSTPVEVKESQHPILALKNNPKAIIMNNSTLLKILYELLHNSHAGYIQDVWELINILPKNAELEEEISNLGRSLNATVDWEKYFDHESIYIMSYSLKIVKSIIFNAPSELNSDWIVNFTQNGGVLFLTNLIFQFQLEHFNSDLGFECLNDLIFLLKHMLSFKLDDGYDQNNTIKKILEIIRIIIQSSISKDDDANLNDLQDKYRKRRNRDIGAVDFDGMEGESKSTDKEEYCEELVKIWLNEDECIRNLVSFLVQVFRDDAKILKVLIEERETLKELVTLGLICPRNYKFKNSIHEFINGLLVSVNEEQKNSFKTILFENMLNSETLNLAIKYKANSGNFFKIAAMLMEHYLEINSLEGNLDYHMLAEHMINYIATFNPDYTEDNSDSVLEGYLIILRVLFLKSREIAETLMKKHDLIKLVLNDCLFSKCQQSSSKAPFPKCISNSARQSAYRLLTAISYNSPDTTKRIMSILNESHSLGYWKSNRLLDWKLSLQHDEKSSCGFVGLKNLGCTCYMNSLMQQFFMIPNLRESILACQDKHTGKPEESALYQLKNIFASLKAYDSQFYNPKDFTQNFDGQKLDIREQMDVDEFFNTLIEKIENHVKDTEYSNIFKHFFGFTISDEFICKGCPHFSERNVYSQSIQLQVLNKKSIVESLKSYVEGELLEGDNAYHCDKCDKKVNALKRQCIKRLPRVLMVTLKRFEFDYESYMKIKVNDYCEFPFELNMEPYTQEFLRKAEKSETMTENGNSSPNNDELMNENNKPNNYYKYNLTGVIIHTGTSESGHYYSLIKDSTKQNWCEFNDTNVKEYDIADLPNEAFGGSETVFNRDNKKETIDKQTNAYLLFYTRQYEYDEDAFAAQENEESKSNYNSSVVKKSDKFSNISSTIMDRIDTDNLQYWIMKILFSTEYHSFITDLLINANTYDTLVKNYCTKNDNSDAIEEVNIRKSNNICNVNIDYQIILNGGGSNKNDYVVVPKQEDELSLFKFACSFFFNVLIRARDKHFLPQMVDIVKAFINKDLNNAEWLLEEFSHLDMLNDYLGESPLQDMRKIVIGVLYAALIKCYKSSQVKNAKLTLFINNVLFFISKHKNDDNYDLSYFYCLVYRFSLLGQQSRIYLIEIGVLNYLSNYYKNKTGQSNSEEITEMLKVTSAVTSHCELNTKLMYKVERLSAFEELLEKKHADKLAASKFEYYLLMTLCELVKCVQQDKQTNPPSEMNDSPNPNKHNLNFTDYNLVRLLLLEAKSKSAAISFSKMMNLLCNQNIEISNVLLQVLLDCVENMDNYELENVLRVFKRFLVKIDDPLKEIRIKTALGKYFQILVDNIKYWSFIDCNVDFIIKIFYGHFALLNPHIESIRDPLIKIIKFLKENCYPPSLTPSKTCTMYKKRNLMFSNKITQGQMNAFVQRHTNATNEKIAKLKEIYTKNCQKNLEYDSDLDLADFKFSTKDKIKFEGLKAVVINVLDEMINIEYDKEEISNTKRPFSQWVETDNKNLVILELYENQEMKVDHC